MMMPLLTCWAIPGRNGPTSVADLLSLPIPVGVPVTQHALFVRIEHGAVIDGRVRACRDTI